MAVSIIQGARIAGLVSCLPERREDTADLATRFGEATAARIAKATGIEARRLAAPDQCASDLAEAAARDLMDGLGWEPGAIDLLVFVSQTPDHVLPATACLLHRRLGLERRCAAFDLSLGCSGFVYGLWSVGALLATLPAGARALLLVGDTTSRLIDPLDRSVAPLFGDAAAAVALVRDGQAGPMTFDLGSDGAGAPYLMVPGGGMRRPAAEPAAPATLFMDGTQVFAFTLREVPRSIAATLEAAEWSIADVDHIVLHQANAQMIRHLGQRIGARPERMVLALADVGNTSSASIPLALTQALAATLTGPRADGGGCRLLLSGFGTGWSWGTVALACPPLAVCRTIALEEGGRSRPSPAPPFALDPDKTKS
ncbi:ketoacyl-ACP synthase III [Azospirillum sp.]|uniref:3-oxoacyl-ACP synthase III family protein n=1 Tax=Azospirillum sp. TaxID=34012 RepID=UPI002D71DEE7|nr:ketoacyl-ACP synthase III [Azospirillum sp.]HYD64574.1 ketoacyl-ACP synthase III [Azospirillum sp.]